MAQPSDTQPSDTQPPDTQPSPAQPPDPLPSCPACGAGATRVVEDVVDEVTVLGCGDCDTTWAYRRD